MTGRPRVLVLRPEPQAGLMAADLVRRGVDAVVAPMLEVRHEPGAVARILSGGLAPDVIVFTSAHAVAAVASDPDAARLAGAEVHAVGPATAAAAVTAGFTRVVEAAGDGEALVGGLLAAALPPARTVVHAAGRDRAVDVAGRLDAAGIPARTAVVYRAEPVDRLPPAILEDLAAGRFDVAVLASRRTAEAFRRALARSSLSLPLARPVVLAISAAAGEPLADAFVRIELAAASVGEALTEGVVALAHAVANNGRERRT